MDENPYKAPGEPREIAPEVAKVKSLLAAVLIYHLLFAMAMVVGAILGWFP